MNISFSMCDLMTPISIVGNWGFLWTRKIQKGLQLHGGFAPFPKRGLCPWTPTASDHRYRLVLRARHGMQLHPVQFETDS